MPARMPASLTRQRASYWSYWIVQAEYPLTHLHWYPGMGKIINNPIIDLNNYCIKFWKCEIDIENYRIKNLQFSPVEERNSENIE